MPAAAAAGGAGGRWRRRLLILATAATAFMMARLPAVQAFRGPSTMVPWQPLPPSSSSSLLHRRPRLPLLAPQPPRPAAAPRLAMRPRHHLDDGDDNDGEMATSGLGTAPPGAAEIASALLLSLSAAAALWVLLGDGGVEPAWAVDLAAAPASAASAAASAIDIGAILRKAGKKAVGGGASGAAASIVQLATLGWLRTSMNYQYKNGGTLGETIAKLYKEGGVARFYQGLSVAVVQLPLSRFGDVAANAFVLAALESFDETRGLPIFVKTALGSISAGLWRFLLMPLDALKTTLQVQGGEKGMEQIKARLKEEGVASLYSGAVAQAVATAVGHWPYFLTFNYLSDHIPVPPEGERLQRLGRNAFLGLCSATVSDCCSNSIRVLKTAKQTSETNISYREAFRLVIEQDGVRGLLGRGLQTRLTVNALQGMLFAVVWRYLEESKLLSFGQ